MAYVKTVTLVRKYQKALTDRRGNLRRPNNIKALRVGWDGLFGLTKQMPPWVVQPRELARNSAGEILKVRDDILANLDQLPEAITQAMEKISQKELNKIYFTIACVRVLMDILHPMNSDFLSLSNSKSACTLELLWPVGELMMLLSSFHLSFARNLGLNYTKIQEILGQIPLGPSSRILAVYSDSALYGFTETERTQEIDLSALAVEVQGINPNSPLMRDAYSPELGAAQRRIKEGVQEHSGLNLEPNQEDGPTVTRLFTNTVVLDHVLCPMFRQGLTTPDPIAFVESYA